MKLSTFLFWGLIIVVLSFLLINIGLDSGEYFDDDKTSNMLYCGYEKFDLSVSCNGTSDCIDFEINNWVDNNNSKWDIVDGNGDTNENINALFSECIFCSNNQCLSGITTRKVNY